MLQPTLENNNKNEIDGLQSDGSRHSSDLFDILDGSIGSAMKIYIDL